jgi:hypothetical protein
VTPSPISRRLRMTSLCASFMKYLLTCLLASALLVSATMFAVQSRQTFSGTITDDECPGADHSGMRMGSTDAACTIACVLDHGGQFVLFDGKDVYELSDQEKPKEFAGKRVTVTGTLNGKTKTIQVDSITAAR